MFEKYLNQSSLTSCSRLRRRITPSEQNPLKAGITTITMAPATPEDQREVVMVTMLIRRNDLTTKIRSIRLIKCARSARKLAALILLIPVTMIMNMAQKALQGRRTHPIETFRSS
jgi:hypothetical protein